MLLALAVTTDLTAIIGKKPKPIVMSARKRTAGPGNTQIQSIRKLRICSDVSSTTVQVTSTTTTDSKNNLSST